MTNDQIKDAPRYLFTAEYIFQNEYKTVDAFPKINFETGWHIQEFYEINIITRGRGKHYIGNRGIDAKEGDVFIIPPRLRHAFSGGDGFDVYHFLLSPSFFSRYFSHFKSLPKFLTLFEIEPLMRVYGSIFKTLHLSPEKLEEVILNLSKIEKIWRLDAPTGLICESYAVIVITILCMEYSSQEEIGKQEDIGIVKTLSLILEGNNQNLTIDQLAKIANMSRTAYITRFKDITGEPPKRFMLLQKIKEAKHLLITTERQLSDIAQTLGFYDTSHFIKAFTKEVGISPTLYRDNNKPKF